MSDIRFEFPLWFNVAFIGLQYWYVFVPAALALGGIGWFGRGLPIVLRYIVWAGAGLCASPLVLAGVLIVGDIVGPARRAAEHEAQHRTLAVAETVGTLVVPAGAILAFTDQTRRTLVSIALPRPTLVAGILLEGTLEQITEREWAGDLVQDQVIRGWSCRAGNLWFTPAGVVTRCTLAAGQQHAGYDLPVGTECRQDPATGKWQFQLPQDGPALRISVLRADLPPGGTLVLTADGVLRRLYVLHEARMVIVGVALHDHIILDPTGLTGELAEPTLIAGVMQPADTVVRLDLATGSAETTTRSSIIDP